jgi:hypothetical protein
VIRSMRRGAIAEALSADIDGPTIDANNGWRKVEAAKGKMVSVMKLLLVYLSRCTMLF